MKKIETPTYKSDSGKLFMTPELAASEDVREYLSSIFEDNYVNIPEFVSRWQSIAVFLNTTRLALEATKNGTQAALFEEEIR